MRAYLLDTNHLSAAIRTVSPVRDRLNQAHRKGYRLVTCWPALCELQAGLVFLADQKRYANSLQILMKQTRIWPMDWSLVEQFGACAKLARERGRVLSGTDLILASFAMKEAIPILTSDRDFEAFSEIKTENWL